MESFFAQLAQLLNAGFTAGDALESLQERMTSGALRAAVADLAMRAKQGWPLAEALRLWPKLFPASTVGMVAAGEAGGRLPDACRDVSEDLTRQGDLGRRLLWPKLWYGALPFIAVIVVSFMVFVVSDVGEDIKANLSRLLGYPAWAATRVLPWLVLAGVGLWLVGRIWRSIALAGLREGVELHCPVISAVSRARALRRFGQAAEWLQRAGVPPATALATAAEATGYRSLSNRLASAADAVREGQPLTQALDGALPAEVLSELATGEQAGELETAFARLAAEQAKRETEAANRLFGATIALGLLLSVVVVAAAAGAALIIYHEALFGAMDRAMHGGPAPP